MYHTWILWVRDTRLCSTVLFMLRFLRKKTLTKRPTFAYVQPPSGNWTAKVKTIAQGITHRDWRRWPAWGCRFGPIHQAAKPLVSQIFRSIVTICGGLFPKMYRVQICNLAVLFSEKATNFSVWVESYGQVYSTVNKDSKNMCIYTRMNNYVLQITLWKRIFADPIAENSPFKDLTSPPGRANKKSLPLIKGPVYYFSLFFPFFGW